MELGDRVIYYKHEQSDRVHSTDDRLAFVTGIVDDNTIDVVVFPAGGPVEFERVSVFDPEAPYVSGETYWREIGADPPDFSDLDFVNTEEWYIMNRRHQQEREALDRPGALTKPVAREDLAKRQLDERRALIAELRSREEAPEEVEDAKTS